ncbi:SH3 domain-containing protein [Paracoccus methylarcula]|uniref:SH3 domain-containing protein n=1 Tax=Paracoccus methylarcula TaxID=72022 RepID=A0A422R1U9_9RHOB|nr:SH3 domain-containing protein [Paracoccus methylarcula]RNF36219.1 SH3 domain-containing protein [Paracoccus methylarcula]
MIRLLFLLVTTLAAIFVVLSVYGSGNLRAGHQTDETGQAASQESEAATPPLPELPETPASVGADGKPPADLVQAATQTPERVQQFPGPDLRPSPEYAGETPEPAAAPTDAQGPILYVTGTSVNFRSGPSTNDRVIGALEGGAAVEALGPTNGDWVHIRDGGGRIGYISGQFLSADVP